MKKFAFLDRDGLINIERGYWTYRKEDWYWVPGIFDSLKLLKEKGFSFVVITNQSGIALDLYDKHDVDILHSFMRNELSKRGIEIEEVYFCPHRPEQGSCLCRKPGSLMIEKAIARFNVDKENSFMIGDKQRDVAAAEGAGIKGIQIESNKTILPIVEKM